MAATAFPEPVTLRDGVGTVLRDAADPDPIRRGPDYAERPMLVFWETTRACLLACRHCRASATARALPGELSTADGYRLIDQVAGFGRPYPILVLTGGDCLIRPDVFELAGYASSLGVPVCLSPSVTPLITENPLAEDPACGYQPLGRARDAGPVARAV